MGFKKGPAGIQGISRAPGTTWFRVQGLRFTVMEHTVNFKKMHELQHYFYLNWGNLQKSTVRSRKAPVPKYDRC